MYVYPADDQDLTANLEIDAAAGRFGSRDFTVSHWFSTPFYSPDALVDVIGNRTSVGHGNFFSVRMRGDGIISMELDQDEAGTNYASAIAEGHPVNDGCWHHLAYVRANDVFGVYIDGVPAALGIAKPARIDGVSAFRVGRSLGAFPGFATISAEYDDVRIYTRALKHDEIQQLASLSNVYGEPDAAHPYGMASCPGDDYDWDDAGDNYDQDNAGN